MDTKIYYALRSIGGYISVGGAPNGAWTSLSDASHFATIDDVLRAYGQKSVSLGRIPYSNIFTIVRVTEVPGEITREVVLDGEAYDAETIQYAVEHLTTAGLPMYVDPEMAPGYRTHHLLNQVRLYEYQADAIEALMRSSRDSAFPEGLSIAVVPVRVVEGAPTITVEEVR